MTREEKAIMYFKNMRKMFCEDYLLGIPKDSVAYKATMAEKEFYDTAIEALEQEPTDENLHREREQSYMQGYEDASKRFRQEPSGDTISRQDAIKAIDEKAKRIKNADTLNGLAGAVGILFDLPSYNSINSELSEDAISRQAVNTLVDELARAISDERCCISRGRSTATIMQDILDLPSVKPQEPKTGQWVEIEAVMDIISDYYNAADTTEREELIMEAIMERVEILPSVGIPSAEPKTGHWIEKDGFDGDVYYDCSECGESWTTIEGTPWDNEWNYCPNCGARMVEPQERNDKE